MGRDPFDGDVLVVGVAGSLKEVADDFSQLGRCRGSVALSRADVGLGLVGDCFTV